MKVNLLSPTTLIKVCAFIFLTFKNEYLESITINDSPVGTLYSHVGSVYRKPIYVLRIKLEK